ncbi:MAG: hypothetical protein GEU91_10295 [Rhizobiales bacterium]|nr:hypothetical protein [Hyphomicrobiales bacterium]
MISVAGATTSSRRGHHRRVSRGLLLLPLLLLCAVVVLAAAYVSYVLWPRWPGPAVAPNAPALPIIVGEVTFNVPPAAIRVPVQRKPGVQERIDLAFLWPSLGPPDSAKPPLALAAHAEPKPIDRVFVTITATNGALAPAERLKTIYPRYTAQEPEPTSTGLVALSFRDGTPYQGEDLVYSASDPERFFIRCTHDGPGPTPGTCLAERRMRSADVIVRFPREWLSDWRAVASGIDRLIVSLKPH